MDHNQNSTATGKFKVVLFVLANAIVLQQGMISHPGWYALFIISVPLLLITLMSLPRS